MLKPITIRRLLPAALCLGGPLFLSLWVGCSKQAEKEPVVAVQTAPVQQKNIQRVVTSEGILFAINQAAITPKVTAPVRKFYVNRGSRVHRGQLLAELENRDLAGAALDTKGAYEQAEATYKTTTAANLPEEMQKSELDVQAAKQALDAAQKVYDSRQNLFQQGALPRKSLDDAAVALVQARNQYEIAQKHLASLQSVSNKEQIKAAEGQLTSAKGKYMGAEAQLGYAEIRSPIDGVVTDRPNFPGETSAAGTPLITVMDISQVIAKAHISQQDAALLKVGDAATLTAPGTENVPAKVTVVSPALDPSSTTVEIWVQAANPKGILKPGSTAGMSIVAQTVPGALVVPVAAMLKAPDGTTLVMVAGADGRAHQRPVETGVEQENLVQIVSGLKPGENVITTGAYGLPDNSRIQVAPAAEAGTTDTGKPSPGKE